MKTIRGHHRPDITHRLHHTVRAACALLLLTLLGAAPLPAATLSWSGGSLSSGNWSDTANWGFSGPPANGDTLIFPALQPRLSNTNNIVGLVLSQIRFAGAGGGYDIRGNAFTLTNSIAATNTAGANTINNAITLSTADVTVNVGSGVSLTLAGILSGSVGVIKSGAGTLTYACSGSNPYAGTTWVNAGMLQLNVSGVSAFGGPLVIGDGSGISASVRNLQNAEILDTAAVTIYNGGLLDLNNFIETIGSSLTLNGGTAQSGTGTLTLSANNTITVNSNSTISGNLNIGSGTCAIVANGNLTVSAAIGGTASITKSGIYYVYLTSANTYSGLTVVQNGVLWIQNSLGLGSTASGTVVSNGATLAMSGGIGVTNESLTLNGPGVSSIWGALDAENAGTNIWASPITLNADSTIAPYSPSTHLRIIGPINGAGGVEKFANSLGTLWFEGNTANTYAGLTKIIAGTNMLAKAGVSDGTIPHDLQVGDATHAATVRYQAPNQIPNSSIVTLNDFCLLDLNGYVEGLGGLVMYGATVTNSAGGLLDLHPPGTVTSNNSTNAPAKIYGTLGLITPATLTAAWLPTGANNWWDPQLSIYATIYGPNGFSKTGTMTVGLWASNSFSGLVSVNEGVLHVVNNNALGTTAAGTVVSNGATLKLDGWLQIGQEPLTLNGPGTGSFPDEGALWVLAGTNSWAGPVTLATDSVIGVGYLTNAAQLTFSGPIGGAGGFTKVGPGILSLTGTAANTYLGASVVNAGTLLLGKTPSGGAIPGALAIGTNCTVRDLVDWQINSASKPVTILDSGLFDLAGHNEWIGPLTLQGAQIATGSGLLYLGGDILVNGSSGAMSQITGNATLWNGTKTINCADSTYSPDFQISAHLGGNLASGIIKTGPGEMSLTSSNSYPGLTTVSDGSLTIEDSFALGSTNTGTVVSSGAILSLLFGVHVGLEPLTLSGPGTHTIFGALNSSYGSNSWDGAITLGSNTTFSAIAPTDYLNLAGPIGGSGDVTKIGPGTLIFSGSTNNTYGGTTWVNGGTLVLGKTSGTVAVPGAMDISGTVKMAANIQTAYTSDVTIQGSGRLETDGYVDYIDSLNGSGQLDLTSGGWLFIGWNGGSSLFNGVISGSGDLYCHGAVTLTGTNTYTGATHIYHGTLLVNGYQPLSPVDFYTFTDGELGGTGVVGPISVTADLRPGSSPGCLTSSNLTFTSTGNFHVELNGTTPCSGYDQMIVHGTNNLANATLNVSAAFGLGDAPTEGQQLIIINNDGADAITGTFSGLPAGSVISAGGMQFRISYTGGDGNDVSLATVNTPLKEFGIQLTAGNGDGFLNPNECNDLNVVLINQGTNTVTGITASLTSTNPAVVITQPATAYPDLAVSAIRTNATPFQISTLSSLPCDTNVDLLLTVATATHGAFSIPVRLHSGSPARFENNTPLAILDTNTVTSSIVVSGITAPVSKVAVSFYLPHTWDSDLNIYLVAPDGTTVELTTGNGGSGDNYGAACGSDVTRAVFDDDAGLSVTAGLAPFVGRFKPEGTLATFNGLSGANATGTWQLRITDDAYLDIGTLQCWSLMLWPGTCPDGGGNCATCTDTVSTGSITTNDLVQVGRLTRNGITNTCAVPKSCPGLQPDSILRHYDAYTFYSASNACISVTLTSDCGLNLFSVAYLGSYDPSNLCANYLGDQGSSGTSNTYSFNVTAGATFSVVVNEVNANAGCDNYQLVVTGLSCGPPLLNIRPAAPGKVRLDWPTTTAGYVLERTDSIWPTNWSPSATLPVINGGKYAETNDVSGASKFYRLRKTQ